MDTAFHPSVEGRNTFILGLFAKLYEPWSWWLDTHERNFMIYLFMNSVAKGKPHLKASYNDIVFGDGLIAPIGVSKTKLVSVIKSCAKKGAITITPGEIDGTPSTYTVDLRWNQAPIV